MKLKTVALTGVLSLAGLGLVGVGAHAAFTTNSYSNQTINAGQTGLTLTGDCLSGTNCPGYPTDLYSVSPGATGPTLTWTSPLAYGSTFTTGDEQVTMTNTGNIPLTELYFDVTYTGGTNLENEAYACLTSNGNGTDGSDTVIYNGPLTSLLTQEGAASQGGGPLGWGQEGNQILVGASDNYTMNIYAGTEPTLCGMYFTNLLSGADNPLNPIFPTPAGGTSILPLKATTSGPSTTTVPSLDNDAEGLTLQVSESMSYQG